MILKSFDHMAQDLTTDFEEKVLQCQWLKEKKYMIE